MPKELRNMKTVKCFICGEDIPEQDIEIKGIVNDICEDCEKLSGCCGADIINGRCNYCKENC